MYACMYVYVYVCVYTYVPVNLISTDPHQAFARRATETKSTKQSILLMMNPLDHIIINIFIYPIC